MSGRHAGAATVSRRSFALLTGATVLGVWFGLRAPDVTPVAPPAATAVVQPADAVAVAPVVPPADAVAVTPVVPPPADVRPPRGGRR
jgi:hypothetical protein